MTVCRKRRKQIAWRASTPISRAGLPRVGSTFSDQILTFTTRRIEDAGTEDSGLRAEDLD